MSVLYCISAYRIHVQIHNKFNVLIVSTVLYFTTKRAWPPLMLLNTPTQRVGFLHNVHILIKPGVVLLSGEGQDVLVQVEVLEICLVYKLQDTFRLKLFSFYTFLNQIILIWNKRISLHKDVKMMIVSYTCFDTWQRLSSSQSQFVR